MRKLSLGENLSGIINHKRLSNWDWIIKILTKANDPFIAFQVTPSYAMFLKPKIAWPSAYFTLPHSIYHQEGFSQLPP